MRSLLTKGKAIKIAIVDDNSEMLRCLRITIQRLAKKLGVARPQILPLMDPNWVVKYYGKNPFPDLVLCDYMMPDMDGFEVLTALRSMGYEGEFIFVTAAKDQIDSKYGSDEARKVISKPYSVDDFREVLSHGRS